MDVRPDRLKPVLQYSDSVIPFCAVIEDGIELPDAGGFISAFVVEIIMRAGPWPIGPFGCVAVLDGVVMDVVYGSPEVGLTAHGAVREAMPAGAAACVVFAIPGK